MNDLFSHLEQEIDEIAHQLEEQKKRSTQNTPIMQTSLRQQPNEGTNSDVHEDGTIMVNQRAISMLLDSETESENDSVVESTKIPVEVPTNYKETIAEESAETEMEDSEHSDSELASKYESPQQEVSTASFFLSKPKPIVFQAPDLQNQVKTSSPTNFVSRPRSIPESDSDSDSNADIIEIYEKPTVQTPPPRAEPEREVVIPRVPSAVPSRPRTGLQSYPIPETEEELVQRHEEQGQTTWNRVKSNRRQPRSSPLKKTKESPKSPEAQREISSAPKFVAKRNLAALEKPRIQLKKELVSKSNRTLIKNALMHVCLAGTVNRGIKDQVLQVLGN
jgi:hypothetical protein